MKQSSVAQSALELAVVARLPVVLWGMPGSGKTSMVVALAETLSLPIEVVVGSIREPSDFAGLPVVRNSDTWFAPPRWAQRLHQVGQGILFLDELTTAPPAVQAAMLRVVLERAVGDLQLPAGISIVAAANPPHIAADGWDLSAPLANRLVHLDWEITATEIADGFMEGFPITAVTGIEPPTVAEIAAAKARVGAFLRLRPELVLVVPTDPQSAGRSWPSPRTWEMAAIALAAAWKNRADQAVIATLVLGAVGTVAGYELLSWLKSLDLPDPQTLLADPNIKLPKRVDQLHAMLGALTAYVKTDGQAATWEGAWDVIVRVAEDTPDVAMIAARSLSATRPEGAQLPTSLLKLAPLLKQAGLMP